MEEQVSIKGLKCDGKFITISAQSALASGPVLLPGVFGNILFGYTISIIFLVCHNRPDVRNAVCGSSIKWEPICK
jgi:hypothetical protein